MKRNYWIAFSVALGLIVLNDASPAKAKPITNIDCSPPISGSASGKAEDQTKVWNKAYADCQSGCSHALCSYLANTNSQCSGLVIAGPAECYMTSQNYYGDQVYISMAGLCTCIEDEGGGWGIPVGVKDKQPPPTLNPLAPIQRVFDKLFPKPSNPKTLPPGGKKGS